MSEIKSTQMNFTAVGQKTKQIPTFIEKEVSGKDYVYWGEDNKFPFYLYTLYTKSTLLQSIINGCVDYTMGEGLNYNESIQLWTDEVNTDGDTLEDVIKKICYDYWIFNNFALQIIYDRSGAISELYWLDICKCRLDKEKQKVYYSAEYDKKSSPKVLEYDVFDPYTKHTGTCVYYFNGHNGRGVYGLPKYNGAITAIETQIEISKFHLNEILNGFSASAIINFNNGAPSDDVKDQIERRIKEKFTSADNAGRFLISWNDSKENGTTIERLAEDSFDERYQALRDSVNKDIFVSMRATPALFGCNPENNGFSKEEFLEAFVLFEKTMIRPAQKDIVRAMNKIFGIDDSVTFMPFKLEDAIIKTNTTEE